MLTEIGAENNTTTLLMMPSDFILLAKNWADSIQKGSMISQAQPASSADRPQPPASQELQQSLRTSPQVPEQFQLPIASQSPQLEEISETKEGLS